MYQALYRKWRPQTFDQVIGQEHITETLKNQVRTGRLSHAYLFIGTRGTGKTTCARILARAVNCEHPVNGNPCGECAACRGILDGSVLDVVELDAASNNGVDNVRALRDEAVFSPATVRKRVYIIDEVHMLSTPAFNALLKILEEPPEHLLFILATTELQKVPATILSRCQRHSFKRIESGVLADHLSYVAAQEHFDLSRDAAELIARLAEGGVRDALSLLDQCSGAQRIDVEAVYSAMGLAGNRRIAQLLEKILSHDTAAALKLFHGMWMDGRDPASLLNELNNLLRDVLMLRVAPNTAGGLISGAFDLPTLRSFSERMTTEELLCAMSTVQGRMDRLREMKNPRTAVELCLISLCDNAAAESISALRARISRLEEQMKNGVSLAPPAGREESDLPWDELPPEECPPPMVPEYEEPEPPVFVQEPPEEPAYVPAPSVEIRKEPAFSPPAAPKKEPAPPTEQPNWSWQEVLEQAVPGLPKDLQIVIADSKKVRGRAEGNVLRVEAEPGFVYGRMNRQIVLAKLSHAASVLAGREVNVILSELKQETRGARDLGELKQFKEVKFIEK